MIYIATILTKTAIMVPTQKPQSPYICIKTRVKHKYRDKYNTVRFIKIIGNILQYSLAKYDNILYNKTKLIIIKRRSIVKTATFFRLI